MDKKYWEKVALDHGNEIFDVFGNDQTGLIRSRIVQFASPEKTALDLGCAIGRWLPVLSSSFKKVYAVDIAKKYIETARENHEHLRNIEFIRADITNKKGRMPVSDFVICINAILTSSLKKRTVFFKVLADSVKKGGDMILVVPSLESILYSEFVGKKWKLDRGRPSSSFKAAKASKKFQALIQGLYEIDNVPTKHYLREELIVLLTKEGFEVNEIQKVQYTWKTEFHDAPAGLSKIPSPWDWMVLCKKIA